MFISATKSVENVLMTWIAPDEQTATDDQHVNKVKELVLKNRRLTVKDLADMIRISEGSVKTILKDRLGLRKVKSRLVPKTLNFLEKKSSR